MRLPRPCLKCQVLHKDKGDYCADCRKTYEQEREKKRSQDPVHQARKRLLYSSAYKTAARVMRQNATHCHICKEPFTDRLQITADHLIPGDPASPLAPAHKGCNSRRGNRPLSNS
jgi:5-methylcytosine-specific restriction endonuclease McrA